MSKIDDVMRAWQEDHQKVSWQDLQTLKAENELLRAQLSEKNIGQGVPEEWRIEQVSDGDIRLYGPKNIWPGMGETWLIQSGHDGFYGFLHRFFTAMLESSPPAPQQKPNHWVVPEYGFLFPSEEAAKRYLSNIGSDAQPIACYTHPAPKQKPLTDEQIFRIAAITHDGISPHMDTLGFARAIEAAHNIGEKQ